MCVDSTTASKDILVPMTYVMSATIMMATTVESHTPLLKGSRKERRLGGAFIVIIVMIVIMIQEIVRNGSSKNSTYTNYSNDKLETPIIQ